MKKCQKHRGRVYEFEDGEWKFAAHLAVFFLLALSIRSHLTCVAKVQKTTDELPSPSEEFIGDELLNQSCSNS